MKPKVTKSLSHQIISSASMRTLLPTARKADAHNLLPALSPKKIRVRTRKSSLEVERVLSPRNEEQKLERISRYALQRTLGTGSFARVRLAVDRTTHEAVVLKIMSKALIISRGQVEHVRNEKSVLEIVRSPFVLSLKDSFQDAYFLYFVMEYVQGGELYHLLSQTGLLEVAQAKMYAAEVVCALSYLHSKKIVYRDLKPENILLTATGHTKLADFGFAKLLTGAEKTYTLCGTPEYLAPEIISNSGHSFECDWWALGVLLYEMTVGKAPFSAESPYLLYESILTDSVSFPSDLVLDLRSLISYLLIKNPRNRATEEQVRGHSFFSDVDWSVAEKGKLRPFFKPEVKNPLDARNFDKYPEGNLPIDERKATDPSLFIDF